MVQRRDLESLVKRIREELRAEGADAGGFTDFSIEEAINSAIGDLSEFFPVKDTLLITTELDTNEYSLIDEDITIENIIYIKYNGAQIEGMPIEKYFAIDDPTTGPVKKWAIWGNSLFLAGEVAADKLLELWVTRAPKPLRDRGDTPETPFYVDEAITQYAISACYRESRDYDRADYHFRIYRSKKNSLVNRGIPQGQRAFQVTMTDDYWGPVSDLDGVAKSDTNPGGRDD